MKTPRRILFVILLACPLSTRAEDQGAIAGRIWIEGAGVAQDAVIYIPKTREKFPLSPKKFVMAQENKELRPHVIAVMAGSTVEFANFDPVFHNIYSLSNTQSFDLGLFPKGESREQLFEKPGIVDVYCSVHPLMKGIIFVMENPYFAVTNKQGRFSIPVVPAGTYEIFVWHEKTGTLIQTITVDVNQTTSVVITLKNPHTEKP